MATIENYNGSLKIHTGFVPENGQDFPLLHTHYIQADASGKRLDDYLAEMGDGTCNVKGLYCLIDTATSSNRVFGGKDSDTTLTYTEIAAMISDYADVVINYYNTLYRHYGVAVAEDGSRTLLFSHQGINEEGVMVMSVMAIDAEGAVTFSERTVTEESSVVNVTIVDDGGIITASHSASEIHALVQNNKTVVANGIYPYMHTNFDEQGERVVSVEFFTTEVLDGGEKVFSNGYIVDDTKDTRLLGREFTCSGEGSSDHEDRIAELEAKLAELTYTPIDIVSFTHDKGSLVEIGNTVTVVTLSFSFNRTPQAVTLDGVALTAEEIAAGTKSLNYQTITANKTFTLVATGENGETDTATVTIRFGSRVFYGAAAAQDTYDSAFVNSLGSMLTASRANSVNVTAGEGQYIYYASPVSLGECSFYLDGLTFEGGLTKVATVEVDLSAQDDPVSYYVYRSDNANLGDTSIKIA